MELIIATYAAVLSTVMAFLNYRNSNVNKLLIIAEVGKELVSIDCQIINTNRKPLLVRELIVSIGSSKSNMTELIRKELDVKKIVNESEILYYSFSKKTLQDSIITKAISQKEFQRLWLTCITSINRKFTVPVNINPSIIKKSFYHRAEQFIATDLFLGFEQLDSKTYPYSHK